ncbi:MAG: hypothetical protein WC705_00465 [Candidatus Paceibacterota bacterium]|jgi:hypothetical protein
MTNKTKNGLDKTFQKVLKTPAGFDFFMAIHDFIEHIELNASLLKDLSSRLKINKDLKIPGKYEHLKKIYQGLEDINNKSKSDLGHNRYVVIVELNKIKNKDVSESNFFWKKRELFRKSVTEIYNRLVPELA